jgi:SagB-type dehydrogenase family enzyme
VQLPEPARTGTVSVEEALAARRSIRAFASTPMSLHQVGQLLWAAQGMTSPLGLRTAPSAGALYPLELYLLAGDVAGIEPGVYRYRPQGHVLSRVAEGDRRADLAGAAYRQGWIAEAAAVIAIAAVFARTERKYGDRAGRYVYMEAGHAAQNTLLEATALGLAAVPVGAFEDGAVGAVLSLRPEEKPLCLIPLGVR